MPISTDTLIGALSRILAAMARRVPSPEKRLEVSIVGRGIVAEVPENLPFQLVDLQGNAITTGVYAALVRVWNRGEAPIVPADIPQSAPLTLTLGGDSYILGAKVFSHIDGVNAEVHQIGNNILEIVLEGLTAGEDFLVSLYFTSSNPYVELCATGRVLGQLAPLDLTGREGFASLGERVSAAIMFGWIVGAVPAFIIPGALILHLYGWKGFRHLDALPFWLGIPFCIGLFPISLFLTCWAAQRVVRSRHPKGFPLTSDLEPSLHQTLKGLLLMAITGRRFRVSASLFSLGEPALMSGRKIRKRSIHDWFE
jgi:hypothetical protein